MHKSLFTAACCAAVLMAGPASAVTISESSLAAGSPAITGTGLNGAYWNTNTSMANNAAADNVTKGNSSATFLATTVDYTNTHTVTGTSVPDTNTLASFLGTNASGLSGANNNTLDTSVYLFTGWINVTTGMDTVPGGNIDVNFRVGSDDGMRLNIGGATVTQYDAPRPYGYSTGTASFTQAGLYPVSLLFWENGGNTGVDLAWQVGASTTWQDIPTADLYASVPTGHVPEPGSAALIGLGMLAVAGGRGRRQRL
ncbi:MAG: PEP-CTERM sorting domain-containing protein [Rhodocyclaceae bacterium]|nr:PEP-CTERM sorting domain-containing protein [Rhodocyclaceae bacterium]